MNKKALPFGGAFCLEDVWKMNLKEGGMADYACLRLFSTSFQRCKMYKAQIRLYK